VATAVSGALRSRAAAAVGTTIFILSCTPFTATATVDLFYMTGASGFRITNFSPWCRKEFRYTSSTRRIV
jgi:hypothetical protein